MRKHLAADVQKNIKNMNVGQIRDTKPKTEQIGILENCDFFRDVVKNRDWPGKSQLDAHLIYLNVFQTFSRLDQSRKIEPLENNWKLKQVFYRLDALDVAQWTESEALKGPQSTDANQHPDWSGLQPFKIY